MTSIRALNRDEAGVLDEILAGLSPRSRYLRFHSPVPRLTGAMRRALLDVDGREHIALVAECDDGTGRRPIGIARLIRDARARDEAEVSVAVVDARHRRGVGRLLVEELGRHAAALGVTRLQARVLAGNEAALGLFRAVFPLHLTRREDDVVVLTCLRGGAEITMDDILADLAG